MLNEIISESQYNKIIAISDSEAAKIPVHSNISWVDAKAGKKFPLFDMNTDIEREMRCLLFANSINDLMVRFIRKARIDKNTEMLVMERLYPVSSQSITLQKRKIFFTVFEKKISELHKNGFLHGDIQHPVIREPEDQFDNIILTKNGLRLVDTGFSVIRAEEEDKFYELYAREKIEIQNFKNYFCREA